MLHDCGTWETSSSLEKLEEAGSLMGAFACSGGKRWGGEKRSMTEPKALK